MNPFKLAISFLLIPRLFLTLLFFPLVLSLIFVYFQLFITNLAVTTLNNNSEKLEATLKERKDNNFIRKIIFGSGKRLPEPLVCRWIEEKMPDGSISEFAPNQECQPSRLDVAIQIPNISPQALDQYVKAFTGNIERVHVCKACTPDIIIHEENSKIVTDVKSIWAAMIITLVRNNSEVGEVYLQAMKRSENLSDILGQKVLHIDGYNKGISLSAAESQAIIVLNLLSLIVISMWLALKAHRKVLDYFSHSGSLLPLVAATGNRNFYVAIWILTMLRVAAFLIAALPFTIFSLSNSVDNTFSLQDFFSQENNFLLWILAIVASLAFATLIASIAELKHRHSILSFTYKYIPLLVCIIGASVWGLTFLFEGFGWHLLRTFISSLPVIGMAPIALAPIIKPHAFVLLTHFIFTLILFVVALRYNARWFAAHLEDL